MADRHETLWEREMTQNDQLQIRTMLDDIDSADGTPPDGSPPGGSAASVEVDEQPAIVRFSVNLARDSAEILRSTAAKKGMTVTDVFRRSIAIMDAIDEELELGNSIQSVDRQGGRTKIVFR